MKTVSGIDFGTTNSAVSYIIEEKVKLVEFENNNITIPTALFFTAGKNKKLYGQEAVDAFLGGEDGRFMKSIKSVLGSPLMDGSTRIGKYTVDFGSIIRFFITHLKSILDTNTGAPVDSVVMGRPVRFNEKDEKLDSRAQSMLGDIVRNSGYQYVDFQYEPVAAAFSHERQITGEKLAMVVDVGGGTSDFTVIKIGDKLKDKIDRGDDILANSGVKVGGDTLDKNLSFNGFMPLFGLWTTMGKDQLPIPGHLYSDLSDWSGINFFYESRKMREIRDICREANEKEKAGRLMELINGKRVHELLRIVEQAKIDLSTHDTTESILTLLKDRPMVKTKLSEFDEYSEKTYEKIHNSLKECMIQAGKKGSDINLVILTGGSTDVAYIKKMIGATFPQAELSDKFKMTSVAEGLAYDAKRRFLGG